MQKTTFRGTLNGLGNPRKLTRYTPDGTEVDGFPAVLFDPQLGMIRILHTEALGKKGIDFVKAVLDDVLEKIVATDAAIASEKKG